jgi:hypothetical protein
LIGATVTVKRSRRVKDELDLETRPELLAIRRLRRVEPAQRLSPLEA